MPQESTNTETKDDITPVNFKLSVDHTHKGEPCIKGETIKLRKTQAQRMEKSGIGTIVNG